jgi:hypothetical protein
MFLRQKRTGDRTYLQIVENRWEDGRSRQRVIGTLGRVEDLDQSQHLEQLVRSAAKQCRGLMVLNAVSQGEAPVVSTYRRGPVDIFERLWEETGCRRVIAALAQEREFQFPVERALFLTVLHRLLDPGSDRAADRWRADYRIRESEELSLHHLYRAMAWLGEELAEEEQAGRTPFAPRTTKDLVEERLFAWRRDLFAELDLVFFDTTSIYFEGEGGDLGRRGHSKDHRPDLAQMVVGAVLDSQGRPLCCELWPGNTTDVKTLLAVVDRLKQRFHIGRVCVVADRGMVSQDTLAGLEARGLEYILGARMRSQNEVADVVLSRAGRYHEATQEGQRARELAPLKVKEVWVEDRRYVVCLNEAERSKDAADREAIVASLRDKLRQGNKALVGNKGYRRYLKTTGQRFAIDDEAVRRESRTDGKWVLRTNTRLSPTEVAVRYKQLWMVEQIFRTAKSLLETRPIYHQSNQAIRGHVFCSFLALVLRKALTDRLEAAGVQAEWADVVRDLDALVETEVEHDGTRFVLRSATRGVCGKVYQATGIALPPTVRETTEVPSA